MEDSIFTKIIKGEIPSHKIYEDDKTYAFLDIHPAQPGHTLVVPKAQVEFIWDLADEDYVALMRTVQKLGAHLRGAFPNKKYIGVSVDGSGVPHAHIHLIPFDTQAELHHLADQNAEPDHAALAELAARLAL